jgi:hypothetical protein
VTRQSIALAAANLVGWALVVGWVGSRTEAEHACVIPPTLQVRRLVIVDEAGRTTGTLAADASGVGLTLADPSGSAFATLSVRQGRAELALLAGPEAASLSAGSRLGGLAVQVPHPERAIVVTESPR